MPQPYDFIIKGHQVHKKKPFIPAAEFPMINTYPHGLPLGGFGAGTISLTPEGSFSGWHLFPGKHIYQHFPSIGFSFFTESKRGKRARVLTTKESFPGWETLSSKEAKRLTYKALYPKGALIYEDKEIRVEVGFFSPIIPHNYQESSYPVAVFPVKIKNKSTSKIAASVMLSWKNLIGYQGVFEPSDVTKSKMEALSVKRLNERKNISSVQGIVMSGAKNSGLNGEFCLAMKDTEESKISSCSNYDPYQSEDIWESFKTNGVLKERFSLDSENKSCALAAKVDLNPKDEIELPFVVTWDVFLGTDKHQKQYTKFFGNSGTNSLTIAKEALVNYQKWSSAIDSWQKPILTDKTISSQYKKALFNELYSLADSSIWDAKTDLFSYLESYDFFFYDTLDVRYYGGFPLAYLWPEIEKHTISYFGKTVNKEQTTLVTFNKSFSSDGTEISSQKSSRKTSKSDYRKIKGALPHDLGSPFEAVWSKVNAYTWQNSGRWKDLNSKFILQAYRSYTLTGSKDKVFLARIVPQMEDAINYMINNFDMDGDYLPENEAFPDQTFDNWQMEGTSAYCGGLFLAALRVVAHSFSLLGKQKKAQHYKHILRIAADSYLEKLWHPDSYFRFDETSNAVMSAQMMGEWYLKLFKLPSAIPEPLVLKSLKKIYQHNFKDFYKGRYGLVNGRELDGKQIESCAQANDIWTGINYAFASHLLCYKMNKEANKIIDTISNITYSQGFAFRTPEGWNTNNEFTSTMYMRPGSIWSIEVARKQR